MKQPYALSVDWVTGLIIGVVALLALLFIFKGPDWPWSGRGKAPGGGGGGPYFGGGGPGIGGGGTGGGGCGV